MIVTSSVRWPNHTKTTDLAKDFIVKITHKDPYKRLGVNGVKDIMEHPWFDDLD